VRHVRAVMRLFSHRTSLLRSRCLKACRAELLAGDRQVARPIRHPAAKYGAQPPSSMTPYKWASGMITGAIVVFACGNKAEIKNVNKDGGKARRGRSQARLPSRRRTGRDLAHPHGRGRWPQTGQASRPARRCRSACSASSVTTTAGASSHPRSLADRPPATAEAIPCSGPT
jgi:hypothetical protein